MTDLRSVFNDIPTGYTPTSPVDASFQDFLRIENLDTPTPLESYETDGYFVYPPGSMSGDTEHCATSSTLSYCNPDPCYRHPNVPPSMLTSCCSSSTVSTDSVNSMTCLEVNTRHGYPSFSDEYLLGSDTTGSAPSTDSSLSPPQSFGSNSDNVLEMKPSLPIVNPGNGMPINMMKLEDNYVVCQMLPISFIPEATTTRAPPCRPQTLDLVYEFESSDCVYEQGDPLTLKSNDTTFRTQDKLFYSSFNPRQAQPEVVQAAAPSGTKPSAATSKQQNRVLEKAFACTMYDCTKRFARIDELKRHQRIHSDVKQFICDVCNKGFTRSDHLMTHRRTHTGERPYPCFHCDRRFARSDERNRHSKVHFREKSKCGRKPKVVPIPQPVDRTVPGSTGLAWTPPMQELSL
ncbi:Early growth response protein 1-B [Fasciola hepatica]|uniref:Early growth response protein 1-B n=1 Tax=Fasciola hepatica TaxID=6192 RepID=A0A2H1CEX8_FASHE|nr:Early growth response protein 1-B [Fasciola hepatica]